MDLIKPVCRALTGKRAVLDHEDEESVYHQAAPIMKEKNYVFDHGTLKTCVESVRVQGPLNNGVETLATPPIELTATLPPDYQPGSKKPVQLMGPHGVIEVVPPDAVRPGQIMHYRLAPPHEFRMEVPNDGAKPGTEARFIRPDGVEISVPVPPNLKPGELFEVLPPALMVRVPQGCSSGDAVVFRRTVSATEPNGAALTEWCRAVVPKDACPGQYFAARIPPPHGQVQDGQAAPPFSRRPPAQE
jgi:hypothetical protein